jgi:hypothetical protein
MALGFGRADMVDNPAAEFDAFVAIRLNSWSSARQMPRPHGQNESDWKRGL